jgi:hypothetical protein
MLFLISTNSTPVVSDFCDMNRKVPPLKLNNDGRFQIQRKQEENPPISSLYMASFVPKILIFSILNDVTKEVTFHCVAQNAL